MSFWKTLFGGGADKSAAPGKPVRTVEHEGYRIEATPYAEEGQYQVSGVIIRVIDGTEKRHRFVRADRFPSIDDAADFSVMKARQLIEQQGERMFDDKP